jgi:hypothetical protein
MEQTVRCPLSAFYIAISLRAAGLTIAGCRGVHFDIICFTLIGGRMGRLDEEYEEQMLIEMWVSFERAESAYFAKLGQNF